MDSRSSSPEAWTGPTEAAGRDRPVPRPRRPGLLPEVHETVVPGPVAGRPVVALVVNPAELVDVPLVRDALLAEGAVTVVVAPIAGELNDELVADHALADVRVSDLDAVLVTDLDTVDADLVTLVRTAHRLGRVLGAWGAGVAVLQSAGIGPDDARVVAGQEPEDVVARLLALVRPDGEPAAPRRP